MKRKNIKKASKHEEPYAKIVLDIMKEYRRKLVSSTFNKETIK